MNREDRMENTFDLQRRADHRLILVTTGEDGKSVETAVQAASCFPWSRPEEFVSLRTDKGVELALIEDLSALPREQRLMIETELKVRNFVQRISRIHTIEREIELFQWKVSTTSGERLFLTHRHEAPRSLSDGKVLIRDISGDLYLIDDAKKLDSKSHKLLWMYLD